MCEKSQTEFKDLQWHSQGYPEGKDQNPQGGAHILIVCFFAENCRKII